MKNKWKFLFLALLSLNLLFMCILIFYLTAPAVDKPLKNKAPDTDAVSFKVQSNKGDLDTVVNHYLQKENEGVIDYQIHLDEFVNLYGTFPILNQNIEMKLSFAPKALENGDLVLKEEEISLGRFHLPSATVLQVVDDMYQFPDWVTIQPNKNQVYVDLQQLKLKSGIQIKANQFDLKKDQISFTLLVPIESKNP
ncbi:YpmS family protein [Bacillus sp. DNRA2]|uniref:YpmS family protein n=1 Tax=Bacillus sp. DNRA2 TaxID=2723053 RepID=UPI00145F0861|nr:YpmS family protein [Bacillus sp. DNRA2]NMD72265.1 YpmS family protein [Bacillus sp. DNRA2]